MRLGAGRVAVVTGAASGIGRALCEGLAARGCNLALVDLDEAGLAATQSDVERAGRRASVHRVDVSRQAEVEALPEAVLAAHGAAHLLVNNAGVSVGGAFEEVPVGDVEWLFGVNFWGAVYGCRFFLPHLRRCAPAQIVNVLSGFGLLAVPGKSAYCAGKFALRGFSEALRAELWGSGVGLTCLYPGPAATNIAREGRHADPAKAAREAAFLQRRGIPLERIAAAAIRGLERDAARVFVGWEPRVMDLAQRCCPGLAAKVLAQYRERLPFT